ncbi:MAG: HAMP domain-containing histidine kinase [Deltaproteobacteria bacterium]|nr:HAMP domain-containing histidine kinase [Deltaproteobacteria bacterium]
MWLEDVQAAVRRGLARTEPWPPRESVLPDSAYRAAVVDKIEQEVKRAGARAPESPRHGEFAPPAPDEKRERLVGTWLMTPSSTGSRFVDLLYLEIMDNLNPSPETSRDILTRAIELQILGADLGEPSVAWSTAKRLVSRAWHSSERERPDEEPLAYAHRLRLMRDGASTPAGRVLTRLEGRDAVRWLMMIEMLQSTGPADPWRLSRDTVAELIARPEQTVPSDWEAVDFPHSWATLSRLERLGLLSFDSDPGVDGYRLFDSGVGLLRELLSPQVPIRAVAGALLEQDAASSITEREFAAATERRAAEWVVETMAHGLRNALGPVSFVLDAMGDAPSTTTADGVDRLKRGVGRAFKLVDDLVALFKAAQSPPEEFDLERAVRDAVAAANGANVEILRAWPGPVQLRGHRLRLVHALVDLVRNARQHERPQLSGLLQISAERTPAGVVIRVDDNGTGVAAGLRTRIFEPGFSTRPGGTGQGLALLREIVQTEYRGTVEVSDSPIGGARFSLYFPIG